MHGRCRISLERIRQIFDKTPVGVKTPRPRYRLCQGNERVLLGYEVEVEYLYRGSQKTLFATDESTLGLVSRQRALASAIAFYKDTRAKVYDYKKSQRGKHK